MGVLDVVADLTGLDEVFDAVSDGIDSITGRSDKEKAKEAAEQSAQVSREAAGKARDFALDANQKALDAQLGAAAEREHLLHFYAGEGQSKLGETYDRLNPVIGAGTGALSQLSQLLQMDPAAIQAEFETSPGYQFRQEEGEKAIRRLANARGHLGSGSMYKDLLKYNQGLATDEYGNFINQRNQRLSQLQTLASMFPTGTITNLGLAGADIDTQLGVQRANVKGDIGDARSSAYLGEGAIKGGYETLSGDILSQLALAKSSASQLSGFGPTVRNIGSLVDLGTSIADAFK